MGGLRKVKPSSWYLLGEKSGNNLGTKPFLFLRAVLLTD